MRSAPTLLTLITLLSVVSAACGDGNAGGGDAGPADAGEDPAQLYNRLGGTDGITRVIDEFLLLVQSDPRINGFFLNASVDQDRLRTCLIKFVGVATGGPEMYPASGMDGDGCRDMRTAHMGLGISTNDFADLAENLVMVLREEGVDEADIGTIQGALAPLSTVIVENENNNETIYLRAMRRPGVQQVIDNFVQRLLLDPKINGYFLNASVNASRLTVCLVRQVCQATGGPCRYGEEIGDDLFDDTPCRAMRDVHMGLGISQQDFADLAGHLVAALQMRGVPQTDVDAIVNAISPLAGDIIEDPQSNANIYQRMGRKPEVKEVIDDFLPRVLADPKINGYFLNSTLNADRLATCLVRQVCQATGGPCKYGEEVGYELYDSTPCKDMMMVHANLHISGQDFADLAGHLVDALVAKTVLTQADVAAIVAAIGPLADQIVTAPMNNETIYHRMGRKPGVDVVISDFVGRVVVDPKINGFFLNSTLNVDRLHTCLVRQVCAATGGPCGYGLEAGPELFDAMPCRDMLSTHMDLHISTADFNDLAAALVGSLTSSSPLSQADIDTIVGVISPLSAQIVTDQFNDQSIYQRVGRKPRIQAIIGDFAGRVLGDATLAGFFTGTSVDRLGTCLVRQVCQETGGPCKYGLEVLPELYNDVPCRDMTATHMGLTNPRSGGAPITRDDFDQLVMHLVDAMIASGSVTPEDRDAIVGVLAPLCPAIVANGTGC